MAQVKRSWAIVAGAVIVVLLIAFFVAQHLLNADNYRGKIEASLSEALGRPVQLGHLNFSLFSGSLVAENPSIADDPRFSTQPFLTAKDIRIGIDTGAYLFHKQIHITGLTIDQPHITLLRADNGVWNYSSLGSGQQKAGTAQQSPGPGLLPDLTVAKMAIKNGTLTIGTSPQHGPPHVWSDLDVSAEHFSFSKAFPFSASAKLPNGGSAEISGHAGPIDQRDASLTPLDAHVTLKHADLLAAGLVGPEQGVSGIGDLDATIASSGGTAKINGKLHVTELKLAKNGTPSAQPVDAQFAIVDHLRANSGKIDSANIQVGHAAMGLTGTYQTQANSTSVQMHAAGNNMPVDDLVAFLPSLGVQLPSGSRLHGGTFSATLDISGPVSVPVISGPVSLAGSQLAGFDLGQKLASIQALTGARTGGDTTIQRLSTNLHYGPDGTRTDALAVVVSGLGSAAGNGMISAGGGLNYHLRVKLASSGVAGVATQALGMLPGVFGSTISSTTRNGIRVTVSGTTSNPVFTPDVGGFTTRSVQKNAPANSITNLLGGLVHH